MKFCIVRVCFFANSGLYQRVIVHIQCNENIDSYQLVSNSDLEAVGNGLRGVGGISVKNPGVVQGSSIMEMEFLVILEEMRKVIASLSKEGKEMLAFERGNAYWWLINVEQHSSFNYSASSSQATSQLFTVTSSIPPYKIHHMLIQSKNGIVKPRLHPALLLTNVEPSTVKQVLAGPHWCASMAGEYNALLWNCTWTLAPST